MTLFPDVHWVRGADPASLAHQLAQDVAHVLAAGLRDRGVATLAVPGGTTPTAFLTALSAHPLEWDKVFVTLTDERWVPAGHPRSNVGMVARTLRRGPAMAVRIVGLYDPDLDVVEGARAWSPPAFEGPFDAVILGMGQDGHTASLFPRTRSWTDALAAPDTQAAWPVTDAPQPEPRLTLTPARLAHTRWLGVLAHGEAKREVLQKACQAGSVEALPLRWFLHRPDLAVHLYHAPETHP